MTVISTTARPAYVYDEVADTWFPVGAQAIAFVTTYVYTATATQTVFSGPDDNSQTLSYTTGAVKVFLNGALLTPDTDYSALNGTSVTIATGAAVNDILVIVASDTYQVADTYTQAQANLLFVSKNGGSIISETGSANALTITNTGTGNSFLVEDSTSPDSTPFVVTSAGRVGIGTDSPTSPLTVSGSLITQAALFTQTNAGSYTVAKLKHTDVGAYAMLTLENSGGKTADVAILNDIGEALLFRVQNTERMRITSTGNVGIGTTTPTNYKLEVIGIVEADNYDIGLTTLSSDSVSLDFSGETGLYTRTAAGNITFTASGYRAGSIKTIRIIPGASSRTLTFPASWIFVGVKPANIAANKAGILTITSFGTTEGDCVAAWAVQA